jgi:hypothetical protein
VGFVGKLKIVNILHLVFSNDFFRDIEIDLRELACGVDWIHVAEDRGQLCGLVAW